MGATQIDQGAPRRIAGPVDFFCSDIGADKEALAAEHPAQRIFGKRPQWASGDFHIRLRNAPCRSGAKFLPIAHPEDTKVRPAQIGGLLQHGVENRAEIAGRGVDDAEHLGGPGLSLLRFVTLGFAPGKLAFQIGNELLGIG